MQTPEMAVDPVPPVDLPTTVPRVRVTVTLRPEIHERLNQIARRLGTGRSQTVALLVERARVQGETAEEQR